MKRRRSRRFQPTMTTGHDELESRQLLSTGFQLVTSASGLTPAAVAAISPNDVVAVGSGTLANGDTGALIETFNGTTWSAATVRAESTGVLNGVVTPSVSVGAAAAAVPSSPSAVTRSNSPGDNTVAGAATQSNGITVVDGTLENDSATLGTNKKGLIEPV